MPGFDITSILDFRPPEYICAACRGLFRDFTHAEGVKSERDVCPVCKVQYIGDDGPWSYDPNISPSKFLHQEGFTVAHGRDLYQHATTLATLVRRSRSGYKPWPTLRLLFEVLAKARHFVHFTSWGISHQLIGALKVTSMRLPVYGFVSSVEGHARAELVEYPTESPNFTTKVIPSSNGPWDSPHQKLLVVDGLIAFKGSANLTNNGLRKSDRGLDIAEVVTDIDDVTHLNNTYFAPVWRKLSTEDAPFFVMENGPPF